ncbi:protein kinase C iota type-like [Rhipicephalus microplus]|uniref:protein kinase C iota type-like n=1 Tax=Rhipicephalus microplus TaxID=6941 RepID=UPI003F6B9C21
MIQVTSEGTGDDETLAECDVSLLLPLGIPVAQGIVEIRNDQSEVMITNLTNEHHLFRGTAVAYSEVLEDVIECFAYVFVAEYYEGCTLQSLLEEGALRDDVIVNIVANVTYALKYIHDRDVMYRNISPTTILIDMSGTARLFDFSFCSHGKTSSSRTGSIPYMAPEVLRMEVYDRTSDYWSLGILTYVLYVRHTPMSIYSAKTNLDHWADRDYMYQYAEVVPIILPKHMPPQAKSLISGLLVEHVCKGAAPCSSFPGFALRAIRFSREELHLITNDCLMFI